MTNYRYRRSNSAALMIFLLFEAVFLIVVVTILMNTSNRMLFFIVIFVLSMLSFLFFAFFMTLSITVDDKKLSVVYGIGLIRTVIDRSDILSVQKLPYDPYSSMLYKIMPASMKANYEGMEILEITLKSGEKKQVKSTVTDKLLEALK